MSDDSPFMVPEYVTQFIRDHLVCISDIANRTGVTKQAVFQWMDRYPEFEALVVADPGGRLFWWPQVKALLDELGLPNLKASEAQKSRRGRAGR